jgi:hypothetical protein
MTPCCGFLSKIDGRKLSGFFPGLLAQWFSQKPPRASPVVF